MASKELLQSWAGEQTVAGEKEKKGSKRKQDSEILNKNKNIRVVLFKFYWISGTDNNIE